MKRTTLILSLLILDGVACRRAEAASPEFDVASIKPSKAGGGRSSVRLTPGALTMENVSLRKCIGIAYNVGEDKDYAFSGPDWLNFEIFDIAAKFPPDASGEQVEMMLQNLLAERLKLRVHRENKELPVYALVVGKGPKMQRAAAGVGSRFSLGPGHIVGTAAPMSALADRLHLDRPVLDLTGLKETFDFTLEWTPDNLPGTPPPDDAAGPSIFTAIQEQLGLKLETQRGSVEILVIDHAERVPTGN